MCSLELKISTYLSSNTNVSTCIRTDPMKMFMLQMFLKVILNVCMTSELYLLDQGPSHGNPDVET